MLDENYAAFTICVGTNILECEDCYLFMRFFNVNRDMFNVPNENNYLCASCSFIHEFYLNIMAFKLTLNNKMHGSEYNTKILEDSLKADYNFDLPKSARILPPRWPSFSLKMLRKSTVKCTSSTALWNMALGCWEIQDRPLQFTRMGFGLG